jgi:hypothetical protein
LNTPSQEIETLTIKSNTIQIPKQKLDSFIYLPINFINNKSRIVNATALLDSGAQGNLIDTQFVKLNNLTMQPLQQLIPVCFADGTTKQNRIQNYVHMDSTIDGRKCSVNFYVTKLEDKKMILGTPFLEETNPDINWQKQTFTWRKENPLQELNHSSS